MAKLIKKYRTQFYFALSLFIFLNAYPFLDYAVVSFPKKESLSYSIGVLGLKHSSRHTKHLTLDNVEYSKEPMVFACGYSFISNGRNSDCGSNFYTPYLNKEATIGWYIPDKFLIFKNDLPQMVSLKVEDKVIISYSDTVDIVHSRNNMSKFSIVYAIPVSILMFFMLIRIEKNTIERNNQIIERRSHIKE